MTTPIFRTFVKATLIELLCHKCLVALSLGGNLVIFRASERQRVRDRRHVSSGCTSVRRQLVLGVVGRFA